MSELEGMLTNLQNTTEVQTSYQTIAEGTRRLISFFEVLLDIHKQQESSVSSSN